MEPISATLAVTGMNATDNPAPGVAVARSLRHEPSFRGRLIGLGYDALDPGFYAEGLLDGGAILPYPSAGREPMLTALSRVKRELGVDAIIPTLDSEMRALAAAESDLQALGIRIFVPAVEQLERASKARLHNLASSPGVEVPESEPISSTDAIPKLIKRFGLPVVMKGVYYGGEIVHNEADAIHAFHRFVATWGVPVVMQRYIPGEEYDVAAIGDGEGGLVGAVAMRKMMITDKGKGWCGITVDNPALIEMTRAVVAALKWRGPLEVEILRRQDSGDLYVIEINPRFPAWIHLSTGAGQNLPYACALLALGQPVPTPMPAYRAGTIFVRISIDQITDLSTFEQLTASGLMRTKQVSS
ncbi:MAG: ATP-grasp domain-containing protein [Myxococcota bacterium]